MEIFKRNYSFEIRANQDKENKNYTLTGRPIVYNSKTDLGYFDELIEVGALDKANLKDVRFLVNHDISKIPLARATEGNKESTMRFYVDKKGRLQSKNMEVQYYFLQATAQKATLIYTMEFLWFKKITQIHDIKNIKYTERGESIADQ